MEYSLIILVMLTAKFAGVFSGRSPVACGPLVVHTNNQAAGNTFKLCYTPGEPNPAHFWQHAVNGVYTNISLSGPRHTEAYYTTYRYYILTIIQSVVDDSGPYRVVCGRGTHTDDVILHVAPLVPLGNPVFLKLETLGTCSNCIKATAGRSRNVTCISNNGSLPVEMKMYKHNALLIVTPTFQFTSVSAKYSYLPTSNDHGGEFRCDVTNNAVTAPRTAVAMVYVVKNPTRVTMEVSDVVSGSEVTILCTSYGGRPGIRVNVLGAVNFTRTPTTTAARSADDTYTVTTEYRKRLFSKDNMKIVSCCADDVEKSRHNSCSMDRVLNFIFPPERAILREFGRSELAGGYTNITLSCWFGDSNPNTTAVWANNANVQTDVLRTNYSVHNYGWQMQEEATIRVSRAHNGLVITCSAANPSFPTLKLTENYTVNITYSPIITIGTGELTITAYEGGELTITAYEGDAVIVSCSVDSNPPAYIRWSVNGTNVNTEDVDGSPNVKRLFMYNVSAVDAGTYRCTANNSVGSEESLIELIVKDRFHKPPNEKTSNKGDGENGENGSATLAVLGGVCALVLLAAVAVIVVVVVRRRRNKESAAMQIAVEERQPSVSPQAAEPMYNNVGAAEDGGEDGGETVEYAAVIPKSQRAKQQAQQETGSLMYADLDFPGQSTSYKPPVRRVESQVEYTTIDAAKAGSPLPDDD